MGTLTEHVGTATAGGYVDPETAVRLEAEYYAAHPHRLDIEGRAALTYQQLDQLVRVDEAKTILAVVTHVAPAVFVSPSLSYSTIVPEMPTPVVPEYEAVKAKYGSVQSVFSPAPTSILGIGEIIGTLMIKHGSQLLVEMPMAVMQGMLQNLMERIGQKAARNVGLRIRTNAGPGRGRHMNIRGRDGDVPGDNTDAYDEPDKWTSPFWVI